MHSRNTKIEAFVVSLNVREHGKDGHDMMRCTKGQQRAEWGGRDKARGKEMKRNRHIEGKGKQTKRKK